MFLLIAQVTAPSPTTELPGGAPIGGVFGGGAGMEIAIVLGVAMFLVLIFGFWATFIRKPQKAYISGATSATQISSRSQSRRIISKESRRDLTRMKTETRMKCPMELERKEGNGDAPIG